MGETVNNYARTGHTSESTFPVDARLELDTRLVLLHAGTDSVRLDQRCGGSLDLQQPMRAGTRVRILIGLVLHGIPLMLINIHHMR